MTKNITIQNTQLPVIEYQGQRVITTELLAQELLANLVYGDQATFRSDAS